ncbi:MAG TPA: dihydrodipicolinate synthase family protein [Acidimicrobiia bacterium]|jgi:dihydrodipicolinate synthase/N-acetylneuraminate lyase
MTPPPEVRRGRAITGMSAVLLPFTDAGAIDWDGFEAHLARTVDAGLVPAVNMDTGFGPVLEPAERARAIEVAVARAPDGWVGGAHVHDAPGAGFDEAAYARECDAIARAGGLPIVFPSFGLAALDDDELVAAHARLGAGLDRLLGFELGPMFHPAGRIFSLDGFRGIVEIPAVVGLKHSSLDRAREWERLAIRDATRPDFLLLTGNDLAIDMVTYGSDYLLGLSTFAPDAFAARDRAWADGDDARFWALNDVLQYLGQLAFRSPVPGYRHDAAMFLAARGLIASDRTHPSSPTRPDADRPLLVDIARRLDDLL